MLALNECLVADVSRVYLIRRSDFTVTVSGQAAGAFENDSVALRITGRFNVAAPPPHKTLRFATVNGVVGS